MIDCHLHIIDKSRLNYPWVAAVKPLDRDFGYDAYQAEAATLGITDVLHMEVDVAEAEIEQETAYVGELLLRPGSLIRGAIAACRPEHPGFGDFLDRQLANPLVRGLRRVLHVMPDALSAHPQFRANIALMKGTGLSFDLCVLPHQLGLAAALVDANPEVEFVLDHCGVPAVKDRAVHPWAESMGELARRHNVAVKISGVVAYAEPKTWTVDDLKPFVEHSIGVFGWDRVVWGSDWPVCTLTASLTRWVEATHQILSGCSVDEKRSLWADNARRIYRLG